MPGWFRPVRIHLIVETDRIETHSHITKSSVIKPTESFIDTDISLYILVYMSPVYLAESKENLWWCTLSLSPWLNKFGRSYFLTTITTNNVFASDRILTKFKCLLGRSRKPFTDVRWHVRRGAIISWLFAKVWTCPVLASPVMNAYSDMICKLSTVRAMAGWCGHGVVHIIFELLVHKSLINFVVDQILSHHFATVHCVSGNKA